jgi:hypothetical protein
VKRGLSVKTQWGEGTQSEKVRFAAQASHALSDGSRRNRRHPFGRDFVRALGGCVSVLAGLAFVYAIFVGRNILVC